MTLFAPHVITPDSALGGMVIEKSLRFNGQAESTTPQLRRTGTTTSSSFSIAMWAKLSRVSDQYKMFFSIGQENDANAAWVSVLDGQNMGFQGGNGTYTTITRLFRDPTSWFHFLISVNSNNFTVYIDGTSVQTGTIRSLDTSTNGIRIGANYGDFYPWNGYLADVYLIDGQAKAPTDFGYTENQTGMWRPKKYTGTFGSGGAHLEFKDSSSVAALGKDTSGNGNDFTPTTNGFNVTAGTGNDSLIDTPSNNFCTLNGVNQDTNTTLSEGNLKAVGSTSTNYSFFTRGTVAKSSGKWYYEVEYVSNAGGHNSHLPAIGWARTSLRATDNPTVGGGLCYRPAATDYIDLDGSDTSNDKPATSTGNVIQVAIDLDAGKIWFGNGGTFFESGNPSTGANANITFTGGAEELSPFVRSLSSTFNFNFGQRAFSYTPPTGYRSLSSKNLATVNPAAVVRPQRFFDTLLYTGNGTTGQSITGLEFKPDFVWIKSRSFANNSHLFDSVRGVNKILRSSTDDDEDTISGVMSSFNDGGFTVQEAGGNNATNDDSSTFVAWCWKAGGAAVSNSDGAITSSVSVNEEAGFSIVSYTGNGNSTATIGHGLGKAPKWIITKCRSTSTQADWVVWHESLSNDKNVFLNQTNAETTPSYGHITDPSNSLINVSKSSGNQTNASGETYISYCWTEIPGFSKFGSYTGNGSADGPFLHLGFRPAFIMLKRYDTTNNWHIADSKRQNSYNPVTAQIYPNLSTAEVAQVDLDILSNGFKIRNSANFENASGGTYIYMAFAEQPSGTMFGLDANPR